MSRWARCVAVVLAIGVPATSRGEPSGTARISRVSIDEGGSILLLDLDLYNCGIAIEAKIVDQTSSDAVRILVNWSGEGNEDECGISAEIRLDAPLGERAVIDTATGRDVTPRIVVRTR